MSNPRIATLSRRQALGLGAALPLTGTAAAQAQTARTRLDVLVLQSIFQDPVGPMIEQKANVTLNNGPYLSSADIIARMTAPGGARHNLYGGVTEILRHPVMGTGAGRERAVAIEPSALPNLADISPIVKGDVQQRDGKIFMIPGFWGYDSVIYNRAEVSLPPEETNTWGLLYDDRFAGRIAWLDQPFYSLFHAGLYLGHAAPETATRDELNEFARFLISKKKNVRALWQTQAQAVNLLGSGECVISTGQIPVRVALRRRGMDVVTGWCKEGVVLWSFGYFIPRNAPEPAAAARVLNAILDPEIAAAITRASGYPNSSVRGAALLTEAERQEAGFDIRERGVKTAAYRFPTDLTQWVEAWNRVKSA